MRSFAWVLVGVTAALIVGAVGLEVTERIVFTVWEPNHFEDPPA